MTTAISTIAEPMLVRQAPAVVDERLARWRRAFILLLIAGVAAWSVVTFLIGPAIVRSGYDNVSPVAAINRAFEYRHRYPIEFYMRKFNHLAVAGLGAWVGFGLLVLGTTTQTFARRMVGTATPGTLGAIRVLVCLLLARMAYREPIKSVVLLPDTERTSMGVMDLIYAAPIGFDRMVHNAQALDVYKVCTVAALLMAALGFMTRRAMIVGAVLYLSLMGILRSFSWFNHSGVVPFYLLLVLILTRSGDGCSVDRLIKLWKGKPVPPRDVATPYYGWARYACWLVLVLPYIAAGMSKLTNHSWRWWQGINLQTILYTDALRPGQSGQEFILGLTWLPDWAFTVMGAMTIVTEIGMGIVLFSRLGRLILPVMTVAMHIGINVLQHILFLDLIVLQVIFYDWRKVRHWLGRRIAAKAGSVDVLYDGRCALCRRSVRLLQGWDLLERLNTLDFRTLDLAAYNAARLVSLDPAELETAMHVVSKARVTRGFAGCRTLAAALPLFWPLVPLLYLPGVSHVGAAAYRWLARNRMAFHTCAAGGACATRVGEASDDRSAGIAAASSFPALGPSTAPMWRRLLGPAAVTGVVCFMLGAWALRVEWYPFTSMQMFSTYTNTGVVTYYNVLATDASGNTYEAPLEKMGRGVSRFRPIMSGGFFNEAGRTRCVEMLRFCGSTHNAMNPGNPVLKLEVEKRQWDFVNHRSDPQYGNTVDRITVTFDAPPSASP